jgi:hypothetical protein
MSNAGPPEPYEIGFHTQPQWSYRTGVEQGFGNEGNPDVVTPSDWGAFWFRNIRVLECSSPGDLTCRRLADARRGQVPVPDGAPPPAPPEPCARTVAFDLPAGVRKVRATVAGKAHPAKVRRRSGAIRVTVSLPDVRGKTKVVVTAAARAKAVRRAKNVKGC